MIKPKLHHVTIKTSRLDEMIEWYGLVIGAKVNFRDQVAGLDDERRCQSSHRIPGGAGPWGTMREKIKHNGMHHCAFEYDSFADLMSSFDRMRKAGVEPAFCLDHGLTISLYYKDPEGNFVELQSDNFGDWKLSANLCGPRRTSPPIRSAPSSIQPACTRNSNPAPISRFCRRRSAKALTFPTRSRDIGLPTP